MATEDEIPFPEPISKEKVLGWWPFHRTEADEGMSTVGFGGGNLRNEADLEWRKTQNTVGGAMLENTGQGYIETHNWGDFGSQMGSNFCIAFTIQTTSATGHIGGLVDDSNGDGSKDMILTINLGHDGNDGIPLFNLRDADQNAISKFGSVRVDDGNEHRVLLNKTSNSAAGLDIYIDGEDATGEVYLDEAFSNILDFSSPISFFAYNDNGSITDNFSSTLGDIVVYGDSLTQTEIQNDWERQPWRNDGIIYTMPESGDLQSHFIASSQTEVTGDTVDPFIDQTGDDDAPAYGDPTLQEEVINGEDVIRYDGNDRSSVEGEIISQPLQIIFVAQHNTLGTGDNQELVDGGNGTDRCLVEYHNNTDQWQMWAGQSISGGTPDTEPHVFNALFDGANSYLRVDGSEITSGDPGSNSMSIISIGGRVANEQYLDGDIGEIAIYPTGLSDSSESEWEAYFSNKYRLSI